MTGFGSGLRLPGFDSDSEAFKIFSLNTDQALLSPDPDPYILTAGSGTDPYRIVCVRILVIVGAQLDLDLLDRIPTIQ